MNDVPYSIVSLPGVQGLVLPRLSLRSRTPDLPSKSICSDACVDIPGKEARDTYTHTEININIHIIA